jgi:hypothetical protein
MSEFGLFDKTLKNTIGFASASDLSEVPSEPGIYAWYLPLKGDDSGSLLNYLNSLQNGIEKMTPATEVSGTGRQRRFTVSRNPPYFKIGSEYIQKLDSEINNAGVQKIANTILLLSFFTEPIYIGMTKANEGLNIRLKQHLQNVKSFDDNEQWNGKFSSRIATVLDDPKILKQCFIAFMPISDEDLNENAPRLIEHILIKTISPSMSKRG